MLICFLLWRSLWGGSVLNLGTKKHRDKYFNGIDSVEYPGCFAMTELHHGMHTIFTLEKCYNPGSDFELKFKIV